MKIGTLITRKDFPKICGIVIKVENDNFGHNDAVHVFFFNNPTPHITKTSWYYISTLKKYYHIYEAPK
tara:strand:+ start:568 stop:771 length:204 start_codon:yes stop_codon:yes gene_type:complete